MVKRKAGRPSKISCERAAALHRRGLSRTEIAQKLGCTQGYISRILNRAGFEADPRPCRNREAPANAQKVVSYIKNYGGTLKHAMGLLNLDVCAETVRRVAKEQGIDLPAYRYFRHIAGTWEVHKPGFTRNSKREYVIPVRCRHCGNEAQQLWRKLYLGNPDTCPACGCQ